MKRTRLALLTIISLVLILAALPVMAACVAEPSGYEYKGVVYEYYTDVPTYHVATLAVRLGKGESFEACLDIWKATKEELIRPPVPGALLFYIYDPYYRRIIDAGRIEGVYQFAFTAEMTGDYMLVFDDREGWCVVRIHHNSPAPLRHISTH